MKIQIHNAIITLALFSSLHQAAAQGTAFSYQGQLFDTGAPANGLYDIRAGLYATNTGGTLMTALYTNLAVPVSNGLFIITMDFGDVFTGTPYWLQIGVRTNGTGASFTPLSPRQELTPTPYAIFAESANLSGTYGGTVSFTNGGDSFAGNGTALTGVNAASLDGLNATNFWETTGNAGASPTKGNFLGTTDNNPLELRVNGTRAWSLQPTTNDANHASIVNLVGGSAVNSVASGIYGGTISGGGSGNYFGVPVSNSVIADFGTVGGGSGNTAGGSDNYFTTPLLGYSTVGGGVSNTASGTGSVVGGGGCGNGLFQGNVASGDALVVSGGLGNTASGGFYGFTTVGGGWGNTASYSYATVAGGVGNTASLNEATVAGGAGNNATGFASTIAGGYHNNATGEVSTVAGGYENTASNWYSTVGGGYKNTAASASYGYATVAGGYENNAIGDYTTVSGGYGNNASNTIAGYATVSGGLDNTASGSCAAVPGGTGNNAEGLASIAAGYYAQALNDDCFVWSDGSSIPFSSTATDQFLIQASGGVGIGINGPQAQLHVSSGGGNSFPQAQLNQQNTSDYSRLRFTVGGDVNTRWDFGGTTTNFVIYSAKIGANMIYLDHTGLTVNGSFVSSSDRNAKAGFEPVDTKSVLERVAALPITRWHFTNDAATPHLGPMAQDFHAAFGLNGADDKHIATVDEEGVALAAIQGLNQKLNEKNAEIQELKQSVADLKKLVQTLAEKNIGP